ncbi:glycosyltransferase family 4 protein [Pseudenhygromyxa sp. WMMC2535]|uniref:glycosyltransferase family 4 protein n=1 Tax=Pseudenhygromyxa sp. WMMC2535 TaxID=2712867 RepID=UPI0015520801|nr:glycosyltransferase family 4 protein [Pseudenhygromyxa sp. WMMC2535]NVB36632.1 glycosyltransferase family 4 protein [Pseudenhygromyxa sp. WMMC2535]
MSQERRWLLVSRPVIGPGLDGGPALLRELIPALPPGEPVDYFGDPLRPLRRASAGDGLLRVPRLPGGFGAEVLERAAIASALLSRDRRRQPLHIFLAPGPVTERVAAALVATPEPISTTTSLVHRATGGMRSLWGVAGTVLRGRKHEHPRPAPVVQTLTCATGLENYILQLEALDAVVALSDHTRDRLLAGGLPRGRVHRIYPGVDPRIGGAIDHPDALARRRAILYAGELDVGATDRLIELARTLSEPNLRGWRLIIACRPDQIVDEPERARLARELAGAIGAGTVEIHGEVDDMGALQRRCALQVFVADKIHRRLDIPLVVLEGLANGLPLVALDRAPIREIFSVGESRARNVGVRVDPSLGPQALVAAVHDLAGHPETLLAMSHDATGLVRDAFSSARMGADLAALHRELLSRR